MQSTKRVPAILGKSLVMLQGQRSSLKPVGLDEEEVWPTVSISINRVTTFFLKFIYFNLFIFGCVGSSLLRAGFCLVAASEGHSSLRCAGFSSRWPLFLRSTGSRHAGFSSCSTWAQ